MSFLLKFLSAFVCLCLSLSTPIKHNTDLEYLAVPSQIISTSISPSIFRGPPKIKAETNEERFFRHRRLVVAGIGSLLGVIVFAPIIGCSSEKRRTPSTQAPTLPTPNLSIQEHADWLTLQIQRATQLIQSSGTPRTNLVGLVKSFEANTNSFAHVYNQAMAVMALLVAESKAPNNNYQQTAQTILSTLHSNQNADGSFTACFHLTNSTQDLTEKETGAIAFTGLAINLYTLKTGDRQFVPMGENIADYLLTTLVSRPTFPGQAVENSAQLALSGEENIAAFSFLNEFTNITTNSTKATQYRTAAINLRLFIESLWNDTQGRFNQGRNSNGVANGNYQTLDTGYAADMQTSTVMTLGNTSGNGQLNFVRALDPTQPNSIKQQLGTQNPSGIAFTLGTANSGLDSAQTVRFANALSQATHDNANLGTTFTPEAVQQIVNGEILSIQSRQGVGTTAANTATGVSGTHGGVILVLRQRGQFITPQLGPSAEATNEMILAKGKVNFYNATEAISQFSSLDKEVIREAIENLRGSSSRMTETARHSLAEPLGANQNGLIRISKDHLLKIWKILSQALSNQTLENAFVDSFGDFVLGVIHHEAVIHSHVQMKIKSYYQGSRLREKTISFEDLLFSIQTLGELFNKLNNRFLIQRKSLFVDNKTIPGTSNIEEFLAQVISYVTYPKGSQLKLFFSEAHTQELLKELPDLEVLREEGFIKEPKEKIAMVQSIVRSQILNNREEFKEIIPLIEILVYHFPEITPIFLHKVRSGTFEERKKRVQQQMDELRSLFSFDNEKEILALASTEPIESAL